MRLRAAVARARVAWLRLGAPGVRGDGAVRRRPRVRDADRPGAAAEPRVPGAVRHRGRAQFLDLAGRDDRRARARRRRLPGSARRSSTRRSRHCWPSSVVLLLLVRRGGELAPAPRAARLVHAALGAALRALASPGARARSRSICSRCCSAARRRCCRFSRPTSCTWARADSACCARRPGIGAARLRPRHRPGADPRQVGPVDVRRRHRFRRRDDRSSGSRRASGCRSRRWSSWAPATWSASTSATCWCSSRRPTRSAAA